MPAHKVKGGYRYGKTDKVYKSKAKAEKQAKTVQFSQFCKLMMTAFSVSVIEVQNDK